MLLYIKFVEQLLILRKGIISVIAIPQKAMDQHGDINSNNQKIELIL